MLDGDPNQENEGVGWVQVGDPSRLGKNHKEAHGCNCSWGAIQEEKQWKGPFVWCVLKEEGMAFPLFQSNGDAAEETRQQLIEAGMHGAATGDMVGVVNVLAADTAKNIIGTPEANTFYGSNGRELIVPGNPVCPGCQAVRSGMGCDKGALQWFRWKCCKCAHVPQCAICTQR